jgi:hypothetical protein
MALLALGGGASAADVTVSVTPEGAITPFTAKRTAGSIFRKVGLSIAWETRKPPVGEAAGVRLHVILSARTPANRLPGALAFAHPFAGCSKSITVFYDRIQALATRPDRESSLLAYVLVHEIAHVLQGVNHHSDEGVMKATWSIDDHAKIFAKRLEFEENDVVLMKRGLAAGCHPNPAAFTDQPVSEIALRRE